MICERLKRFSLAVINHAKDGFETVDDSEYTKRLSICGNCHLKSKVWVCNHPDCGCFITLKAKWRSESCPLSKWPGESQGTVPKCSSCS